MALDDLKLLSDLKNLRPFAALLFIIGCVCIVLLVALLLSGVGQ